MRISLQEAEAVDAVTLLTEPDAGGVEIETGVFRGIHGAGDPRCAAAMAAAHFQYFFSTKINLRRDMVIKLDTGAVRLVFRRQAQSYGRKGLEGVVEKEHLFTPKPAREKGIPDPPERLANGADGK